MVPYKACFHFIGLFSYKALTVKKEKTSKKCCLEVVPIAVCKSQRSFLANGSRILLLPKRTKKWRRESEAVDGL